MNSILQTRFVGNRQDLLRFGLRLSVLTVLTLGIYRFWMKTRLRRWYWSAIRPGGHPLEYVGDPLEKLLGFLVAVVFLAFYIGVFNLVLMFLSFSFLASDFAAYAISFLGVIPILFFAQYRARRYLLARTRWRGIRFGLEPAAWRYSGVAILYWTLTILSFGALWPLMTHRLERFRTDRTWFGSVRLTQEGQWYRLLPPALPALLCLWASIAVVAYAVVLEDPTPLVFGLLTVPALGVAWVHYRVSAFRYLTSTKRVGDAVRLTANPRSAKVLGIYVLGSLAVVAILSLVVAFLSALAFGIALSIGGQDDLSDLPRAVAVPLGLIWYFSIFVAWDVLVQVFIRLPLLGHYAQSLEISDPHALSFLRQRDRDPSADAGGFAEALDVGAAL